MRTRPHLYTDEQIEFLKNHTRGRARKDIHAMFNEHFNLQLTRAQIEGTLKRNKLKTGFDGRFKKGSIPFNKGMKGMYFGGEIGKKTQFKKGNRPINHKPVGTERVNGDDYVDIKIADPNKWRAKHLLVYEKEIGPVPKGHVVIFGDGNRRNFELDNLILVSRKQLLMMNKHSLIQGDAELTRTGIIVANLYSKISERKQ